MKKTPAVTSLIWAWLYMQSDQTHRGNCSRHSPSEPWWKQLFTKAGALWGATPGLELHRRLDKLNAHIWNMSQRLSDTSKHCSYIIDAPVAVSLTYILLLGCCPLIFTSCCRLAGGWWALLMKLCWVGYWALLQCILKEGVLFQCLEKHHG